MKCKDCPACHKGYFKSKPDAYVCTGVQEPFVIGDIKDIDRECTEYKENNMKKMWHEVANETVWKSYELDLDKVESIEDCKKILKFLCGITMKPMPSNIEYSRFGEVKEYFKE